MFFITMRVVKTLFLQYEIEGKKSQSWKEQHFAKCSLLNCTLKHMDEVISTNEQIEED
jgi:hypothetical protein